MKIKKTVAILLLLILTFGQSAIIFAETSPKLYQLDNGRVISPQWDNTNDVFLSLYFTDNVAECVGTIEGVTGTTSISATFKLERKGLFGWTLENTWTKSVKGQSLSFYGTKAVSSGTYRLSVTANVTAGGKTETVSTSIQEKN